MIVLRQKNMEVYVKCKLRFVFLQVIDKTPCPAE
jgi:hypothetical protein